MELFVPTRLVPILVLAIAVLTMPAYGQVTTPCSPAMISSFTPCLNFITNSSANGTSPTADCCSSLRALTGTSMSCLCLIVTGGVPFRIPINRTTAINLPRACNMPGVPVQCRSELIFQFLRDQFVAYESFTSFYPCLNIVLSTLLFD